ncbi:MAG: HD domain-containing protein [Syntrophales bacterium]|jgi:HD superfamily phosphohydrolase|nr:HD domain-containing protein [Syntrophales bacterium]MCK9527779.1 HD domain-containing protein [Syntrophales bacterium]MDX9922124.1 HD domain-containing protein [Syntrophales bacterium]
MKSTNLTAGTYQGIALIADPIYTYIWFTVPTPDRTPEKTEKDLIDSPWMQRLRRIYQLQSARWVFPAAEHTRFQHVLGTMHRAGEFGRHLYPSLQEICPDVPSINCVEELLRVAGLLHDVGHGPYGHFFDEHFLAQYGLTHEILGQVIIEKELGGIIKNIKRSPAGNFAEGERISPRQVAFLIRKPQGKDGREPRWLHLLRQLFSGVYTVDNMDYVRRDAYMSGFSMDIVDTDRLCFYSFFTSEGLTLHQAGTSALSRFLQARLNLYSNVYYHRTTRALDLHLQEIFKDTIDMLFPCNPLDDFGRYRELDEWSLYHDTRKWASSGDRSQKRLGREWNKLYTRRVKWKMSFFADLSVEQLQRGAEFPGARDYERKIREHLPNSLKKIRFRVDLATQDPRPINPMVEGDKRINIFNPSTDSTSWEPLRDIYRFIPSRVVHFRIFSLDHRYDEALSRAAEDMFESSGEVLSTNI